MKVQIFDVEHGFCALVTSDTGTRILVDCGHNSTTNWRPSKYLSDLGVSYLERMIVTNYDEDHASDLPYLLKVVYIAALYSNPTVSDADLQHLKSKQGIGNGIQALAELKSRYTGSAPPEGQDSSDISTKYFWNSYPTDFDDENNLSMVVIMKAHGLTICFPGDMEVAGWRNLLKNPNFVAAIKDVNIFVASHHGRGNGCCEELFTQTGLRPAIVVISDSGIEYATQETVAWYRSRVTGIDFPNGDRRHVLTTRRDGRILIEATPNSTLVSPWQ